MSAWNFDMDQAPRWKRLQIACRVGEHRWTLFAEVGKESTSFDYAWREPRNMREPLAPLPE